VHYVGEEGDVTESILFVPMLACERVVGVLQVQSFSLGCFSMAHAGVLGLAANVAAVAIENARLVADLRHSNSELRQAYDSTLEGWSRALDLRDKETEGHSRRVTDLTVRLVRAAGLSEEQVTYARWGALLHDIGKVGIPDAVLLKAGPLDDVEWQVMRQHPLYAHGLLAPIEFLRPALDIPYCHHERWDGAGYPRGLRGDQIPLAARLFAVVDIWDALRSDRPYRQAWPEEKVHAHLLSLAGSHLDPAAVELFFQVLGGLPRPAPE
jgi:HD-GYP domain-containing protein (c-di-GMP phosphodiesterase class II)